MIKDQFPVDLVFKIQKELNILNKECLKKTKFYKSKKKNEIDPVTKQDIKIEKFLRKSISKLYPNHSILGEEFKEKKKIFKVYLDIRSHRWNEEYDNGPTFME